MINLHHIDLTFRFSHLTLVLIFSPFSNETIWPSLYQETAKTGIFDFISVWRYKTNYELIADDDKQLLLDLQYRCYIGQGENEDKKRMKSGNQQLISKKDFLNMNVAAFDDSMFKCNMIDIAEDLAKKTGAKVG